MAAMYLCEFLVDYQSDFRCLSLRGPFRFLQSSVERQLNCGHHSGLAEELAAEQATLETGRLILRPFDSGDLQAAFGWFGDPTVMRFTPTGPDSSIDQTKARLANYQEHQTKHGFSKWITLDGRSGRPIDDSGLLKLEEQGWIDLGFRLAPSYWGKGLATEAASAWVRAAFDDLHIDRLTALVHPENVASIRVSEKLSFRAERRDTIMGMKSIVYSLDAKDV